MNQARVTPAVLAIAPPAPATIVVLDSVDFDDVWLALRRAADSNAEAATYHAGHGHELTAAMCRERAKRNLALSERLNAARFGRG